ncbi:MAG: adenosylhomocysteinase [Lachnospiraceae bacterium]|nr:adenosylhomocysteinase [Lachnospiraceae bacterium]
MSDVRDMSLAASGCQKIDWVRDHMPVLRSIDEDFKKTRPFEGLKLALSIHMEAKTAYLATVLQDGGAKVYATGSNVLSTQDDVAAGLASRGVEIFAYHGATEEEYNRHLSNVLEIGPNIIIDDGGDLVNMMHNKYADLLPGVIGGCEETTTGIQRLKAMDAAGELKFPMMMVNNAQCKFLFDNRYGTGQSVWTGINRTTNLIVSGKKVVVAGYGWCGKGVAMRAKGLGARVYVTEVDPIKAVEAIMDGFEVMPMAEAAKIGDFFVTVTGCKDVITTEHMLQMKDGAILCNAGHFNCEVAVEALEKIAVKKVERRANIMGYYLENGRSVNVLAEGRLVNLAAGDGHPAEIMDMSFAIQALCAAYLANNRDKDLGTLQTVPAEIDREVAERKLSFMDVAIDHLTEDQQAYIDSWNLDE